MFTTLVVCPVKVLVFLNCLFLLLFLLWSVWILFLKWFRKSVEFSGIIWGQLYLLKLLCCIGHLDDERLHIYFLNSGTLYVNYSLVGNIECIDLSRHHYGLCWSEWLKTENTILQRPTSTAYLLSRLFSVLIILCVHCWTTYV